MKKLLIIILISMGLGLQAQTILRVNNIPTVNAPFRTIAAAVAVAGTTDTILVEGSPTAYDATLTLSKRVTIIGPGYFINGSVQANPFNARMGQIIFNAGSEGSTITGLELTGTFVVNISNLTISNNKCNSVNILGGNSNLVIKENYIVAGVGRGTANSNTSSNILITNNFIGGTVGFQDNVTYSVIVNNVIGGASNSIVNAQASNNIFTSATADPIDNFANAVILNNVFVAAAQSGADATNILGAVSTTLFLGLAGNNTDTQWRLKAGSPAIGAGSSGLDCGMYGGANPYKPFGILPGQPTLTGLTLPGSVPVNGTLNVKVSAKVN
ncbi:MAG: hypothetical protein HOP30_05810 [Cyclobacteriaceae bacterium]|nr:hypothetical protein [Cyclobacteriaceae bacterium]